ncbi:MAG: phosphotransferase [Hyphomicrobium sp.]|jgi:thiamine kinase-like enzyme
MSEGEEGGDAAEVRTALTQLGFYDAAETEALHITRLGGLTNRVFAVNGPKGRHVLRIPGRGTEEYIDRRVEKVAAEAAARAGVSPKVLAARDDGLMLSEAIVECRTMSAASFASVPGAVARAARALRVLHDSGEKFTFTFALFVMVDQYLAILKTKNASVPNGYYQMLDEAAEVRAALAAHPLPSCPCHCDPLAENFLDTGQRMWIVDWEYSGMNDPAWDIGDLAVEAELSPENERILVETYFGGVPTPYEHGRVVIYKAMCDLLWTLWGLIQHANANPADDFWAYANRRFDRCRALMATPEFAACVRNVAAGPNARTRRVFGWSWPWARTS